MAIDYSKLSHNDLLEAHRAQITLWDQCAGRAQAENELISTLAAIEAEMWVRDLFTATCILTPPGTITAITRNTSAQAA